MVSGRAWTTRAAFSGSAPMTDHEILPALDRIDRIGVDTETTGVTYDDRPVGLSWALPDGRSAYARWGHEGGGNNCDLGTVKRWVENELDRPDLTVYLHNAAFDLRMLAYEDTRLRSARVEDTGFMAAIHNELEPRFSLDDLGKKYVDESKRGDALWQWCSERFGGAATRRAQSKNIWRAPGSVVEEYAEFDAELTLKLADRFRPLVTEEGLDEIYEVETRLIPLLLDMHLVGVRVDIDRALQVKDQLKEEHKRLERTWESKVGSVNYNSTPQLAKLFDTLGLDYPHTEKGNPSITKDVLTILDHPVADLITRLRKLKHYTGTFIDSYILDNADSSGVIHGEFHPLRNDRYGTVSGRFSSGGGLNLQNIPSRDEELAPLIRSCFVPYRSDLRWLKEDYSQIEYRYLAHYAGGNILKLYNDQPDVDFHQMCADLVGIPRGPAKNINFGLVYGMGVALMARQLGLPLDEASELLEEYHRRLPEIRRLYRKAMRRAGTRGWIETWGGRKRRFKRHGRGHKNTHVALNALLQGSAADLIKLAMLNLVDLVDWDSTFLHLTVHDELDFSIPRDAAGDRFIAEAKERMEDFELRVPVIVDTETGENWGTVKPYTLAA